MTAVMAAYEAKRQRLVELLRAAGDTPVRLEKDTSNLFRDRRERPAQRLDVRGFNQILRVDAEQGSVEVEAMTPFVDLVAECLKHGVMPTVVPQLKSITIGGAVTGIGIESSSWRYGLVHETIEEMEILLADGRTVVCSPDNEHADLFFGFPNSYGTLGYALKLKAKVVPVKPFVKLTHLRYDDGPAYFQALGQWCEKDVDFIDGTVFGREAYYLSVGRFVDQAPYLSDYTGQRIYYRSIRERDEDYLTTEDYIWRWDTDWFWCSKNVFAQNPLVRRLLGRSRLNSVFYTKLMRWNSKWKLMHFLNRIRGLHTESVIQDVDIPLARCPEFLDFYLDRIRFTPVWICPFRAYRKNRRFGLYPTDPERLYVNFGFWDVISGRERLPEGHYNRLVEHKVMELGGIKSLYSDSFYTPEEFWRIFDKPYYDGLKEKYDPSGKLRDLYAKCVLRE